MALAALAGVVALAGGGGTNGECLAAVLACPAWCSERWLVAETLAARLVESVGVQSGLRDWWRVVLAVLRRGGQGAWCANRACVVLVVAETLAAGG